MKAPDDFTPRYRYQRLPPLMIVLWLVTFCAFSFAAGYVMGSGHDVLIELRVSTRPSGEGNVPAR